MPGKPAVAASGPGRTPVKKDLRLATPAGDSPTTVATAPPAASTPQSAAPAMSNAAANPRQACEDRLLLAFQVCMANQCAKPAFSQHPLCMERKKAEQRRIDAEQSR